MKTQWSLIIAAIFASFVLLGCGNEGPTGTLDENYLKNAEKIGTERREIFVRSGGEYANMSPDDKKKYLDSFKGDEKQAQAFWDLMKNPPSSFAPTGAPQGSVPGAPTGSPGSN